jgi:hypothetical protein
VSIKRLAPEAIETFAIVLHVKRKFSARATYLTNNSVVTENALLTESGESITTEASENIITES